MGHRSLNFVLWYWKPEGLARLGGRTFEKRDAWHQHETIERPNLPEPRLSLRPPGSLGDRLPEIPMPVVRNVSVAPDSDVSLCRSRRSALSAGLELNASLSLRRGQVISADNSEASSCPRSAFGRESGYPPYCQQK